MTAGPGPDWAAPLSPMAWLHYDVSHVRLAEWPWCGGLDG
jgi:hypothetical protein